MGQRENTSTQAQREQLYQAVLGETGAFDYSGGGSNTDDSLRGTSRTTPYGANQGSNNDYVAWYNPHGGSTFMGITPTGKKEFISKDEALNMGYVPAPRATSFQPGYSSYEPAPQGSNPPPNIVTPPPTPGGPPPGGGTGGNTGGNTGGDTGGSTGNNGGYTDAQVRAYWIKNPDKAPEGFDPFVPPNYGGGDGGYNWDFEGGTSGAAPLFGGGGHNPDDYNFERYVPGQESPWGIPEIEGGNKDFYRNQFMNLLREDQNFQNDEIAAGIQRQYAEDNPVQNDPFDWTSVGVRDPQVAEFDPATGSNATQALANWITPGETTNYQIYQGLKDRNLIDAETANLLIGDDPNNPNRTSTNLSNATSLEQAMRYLPAVGQGISQGNYDRHRDAYGGMFTRVGLEAPEGGGPVTSPGYALPIQATAGNL